MLSNSFGGRDLNGVLETLRRYDRIEKLTLQDEVDIPIIGETRTRDETVFYAVTEGFDPSQLSYDGQLQYDGELVDHVPPTPIGSRQTQFDDFGG
jgi:hypothetical protein